MFIERKNVYKGKSGCAWLLFVYVCETAQKRINPKSMTGRDRAKGEGISLR